MGFLAEEGAEAGAAEVDELSLEDTEAAGDEDVMKSRESPLVVEE